jgi:hypothetical protein
MIGNKVPKDKAVAETVSAAAFAVDSPNALPN